MKIIENFSDYNILNEKITFNVWNKIVNFFRKKYKKGAWEFILKFLKSKNELPKGVEYFAFGNMAVTENILSYYKFNENIKYVELDHADANILNEEADEIAQSVMDTYNYKLEQNDHSALFIWGAPGIGKTEIIIDVAKKLKLDIIIFHLSQIEPIDFRGIPKIEKIIKDGQEIAERTVNKLPMIFPTDNGTSTRGGILFLDELNRTNKMVLSAALPLVLDGQIGDYTLPSKWIVIAAANRKEDIGYLATDIEPALANRFQHINYTPTVEKWTEWAMDREYIDANLISFLNFKKDYFHKLKSDDPSMAWPSPRSWSKASRHIYTKNKNFDLPERMIKQIYSKSVGVEAAIAFIEYLKLKLVFSEKDIKDVYEKGKIAKKPVEKLDVSRAIMSAIAFYKKGDKLTTEELNNVLEYANDIANFEIKTTLMSFIKQANTKDGKCYLKEEEPWKSVWIKYVEKWYKEEKNL